MANNKDEADDWVQLPLPSADDAADDWVQLPLSTATGIEDVKKNDFRKILLGLNNIVPSDQGKEVPQRVREGIGRIEHGLTGGWSDKIKALKDALLSGKLAETYETERKKLEQAPGEPESEGIGMHVLDPARAAKSAIEKLYDEKASRRMDEHQQWSKENPTGATVLDVGGMVLSPVNKILRPGTILGGAAQAAMIAEGKARPGEDVDLLQSTLVGGGMSAVDPIIMGVAKASKPVVKGAGWLADKASELGERVLGKAGSTDIAKSLHPDVRAVPTGTKYTQKLKIDADSFVNNILDSGLSPDANLSDVWKDPQLKEKFLQSVQRVMSTRERDAYMIPIKELDEKIGATIASSDPSLKKVVNDFLSGTLKMTPKQRAEYFRLDPDWADATITDPRFMAAQEQIKGLLGDVEMGKLNLNLEDVAQFGEGARTAEIGGTRFKLTPDMKTEGIRPSPQDVAKQTAAQEALRNIQRGRKQVSRYNMGETLIKGVDTADFIGKSLGAANPETAANAVVTNSSMLRQLARMNNSVGTTAKSILEDYQQGNGLAAESKAFLLATDPEFRKLFLGSQPDQAQP